MRLGQIRSNGAITAAVFEGKEARPIPGYTLAGLIIRSEAEGVPIAELAATHASHHGEVAAPLIDKRCSDVGLERLAALALAFLVFGFLGEQVTQLVDPLVALGWVEVVESRRPRHPKLLGL